MSYPKTASHWQTKERIAILHGSGKNGRDMHKRYLVEHVHTNQRTVYNGEVARVIPRWPRPRLKRSQAGQVLSLSRPCASLTNSYGHQQTTKTSSTLKR